MIYCYKIRVRQGNGIMPKVSIIVPVHNSEKTLRRCIESALRQDFEDFELILMDDGSSDKSASIINEYRKQDNRVRGITRANAGVSSARNRALARAQGDYIQFLDSDDWLTPDSTRLMVQLMEEKKADMVIADFYRVVNEHVSVKGDIDEELLLTRTQYAEFMMQNPADFYYGVLWNKLYRRSIISRYRLRMDEKVSWSEDFIFNMEYVLHCDKIAVLKAPVYYYIKTEGSLVSQGGSSIQNTVRMKLNVIEYYSDFYRHIYDEKEYARKRPAIYTFLLEFARDSLSMPMIPGTKKLGREGVPVIITDDSRANIYTDNYYLNKFMEKGLHSVSIRNDLTPKDLKTLIFLDLSAGNGMLEELMDFTGMGKMAAASSLSKLRRREFLKSTQKEGENDDAFSSLRITEKGENVLRQIRTTEQEADEICFRGFTDEQREAFKKQSRLVVGNIKSKMI